jgi:2-iminobutanoate/2-iminopropanoate deaminase
MRYLLLSFLFASILHAADIAAPLKTDKYMSGSWEDDIGFRQAVRVGQTLYISGTVGSGDMPVAIDEAYRTLEKTLQHYGLTFRHVVKETIYTTQLDALKANLDVRKKFYGTDYPAATWVQIARLYDPAHVIEVELIAVFPE